MSFKAFVLSSLLAATAVAQYGGSSGGSSSYWGGSGGSGSSWGAAASCPAGCQPMATGSSSSTSGELIVQVVSVSDSNGSLSYFPNNVQAPVGSIVQFQFHPKNHTVSESSFAEPCKPIAANLTSATHPGLHSGFQPVSANDTVTPVYNVLVNDTKAIWVYCGQTNHCQKGMAMVINQNNSSPNTIEKYIENAMALALTPTATVATAAATSVATSVATAAAAPPETTASVAFGAATTSSVAVAASSSVAIASVASSSGAVAPATFTGAAVHRFQARDASAGMGAAIVLGAVVALV